MSLNPVELLYSGHGFGINTDLFDTNVINLAAVVIIVVSVLGDALRDLLGDRKKTIVDNLATADAREQEAEDKRSNVKDYFNRSQKKADEIYQQGLETAKNEKEQYATQTGNIVNRLKQFNIMTLRSQQQKFTRAIAKQIILLSVDAAEKLIEQRSKTSTFHSWVNTKKMTYYVTIQEYAQRLV